MSWTLFPPGVSDSFGLAGRLLQEEAPPLGVGLHGGKGDGVRQDRGALLTKVQVEPKLIAGIKACDCVLTFYVLPTCVGSETSSSSVWRMECASWAKQT